MSVSFALGKESLGVCDRCGAREEYLLMRDQVVNRKRTGLRVCRDCLDKDHPQLRVGMIRIDDPQALRNARPEVNLDAERTLAVSVPFPP